MRRWLCRARLRPMRRRMCCRPMPVWRGRRMRRAPMRRLRSGILCGLQLRMLPLVGRLPALLEARYRLRCDGRGSPRI